MQSVPAYAQTQIDLETQKHALRRWAANHPFALVLDNCGCDQDRYGQFEFLVGVADKNAGITTWEDFARETGWMLGGLPYDLKNRFEPSLDSSGEDRLSWPEVAFFRPDTVIVIRRGAVEPEVIRGEEPVWNTVFYPETDSSPVTSSPLFRSNFNRQSYLDTVKRLKEHIRQGDFYEINLSQQYAAVAPLPDPMATFERLIGISPTPFAAFFRFEDRYLLCASPERFLQSRANRLITQPIKGTSPRFVNPEEDAAARRYLQESEKERAENVMIVDLSRHDLQRVSEVNSVRVPHLFEVQSFPQVHQLVSTVRSRRQAHLRAADVLENVFPPGSMTGAPKVRTMEAINTYEPHRRGLYAGSVGYFTPGGDFDLNVVIRSLQYHAATHDLTYAVGGAITYDSKAEDEYTETLLKAAAIRRLFD